MKRVIFLFLFFAINAPAFSIEQVIDLDKSSWGTLLGFGNAGGYGSLLIRDNMSTYLLKDLKLHSNNKSKGDIVINSLGIASGNHIYKFDDIFKTMKPEEVYKVPGFDFVILGGIDKSVRIKFDNLFLDGKGEIVLSNEILDFSLKDLSFKDKDGVVSFGILFAEKKQKDLLERYLESSNELKKFVDLFKECVRKKSEECLWDLQIKHFGSTTEKSLKDLQREEKTLKERFFNNIFRRFIFDDPKSCERYMSTRGEQDGDNHIPSDLYKITDKSKSYMWDSLEKMISLKLDMNYISFHASLKQNGIELLEVLKKKRNDLRCSNGMDVNLYAEKENGVWKIRDLEVSSDPDSMYSY